VPSGSPEGARAYFPASTRSLGEKRLNGLSDSISEGNQLDLPTTQHTDSREPMPLSRAERLASILRERIMSGVYRPGERIREQVLQKEFGYSNGPVREALQIVAAAGLAERAPWQGVRVLDLNAREILELFQLRAALMQYLVELAARHGTDEVLAESGALKESLKRTFHATSEAGHPPAFTGEFSAWLLKAAGNATIGKVWDNTISRSQVYVNASLRSSDGAHTASIVYGLIDAIAARDVLTAMAETKRLARQTLSILGIEGPI
jgi:DNA-binding GntR family transcriptional regulator